MNGHANAAKKNQSTKHIYKLLNKSSKTNIQKDGLKIKHTNTGTKMMTSVG